ncbi:hypothetical protein [Microtetraspora malaysiensis]|uniref:hypothetical protein n=1 Tax=Microtetraspora malaysiensis TaxID=161358 RepID=UPI003D8C8911
MSSPLQPSIEFRRTLLPSGCPGLISRTFPGPRILAYVDEAQFAPELEKPLAEIGMIKILGLLQPVEETLPDPAVRIRVRRTGDLGHELAVAEIAPKEITVGVEKSLITEDLANFLSEAGTSVTRDFIRRII